MLGNSISLKRIIFDSTFLTYSVGLIIYSVLWILSASGSLNFTLDKEFAVQSMSIISASVAALFALMVVATFGFFKMRRTTLGDVLFASPLRKQEIAEIPFFKSFWGLHLLVTLSLTLAVSVSVTDLSFTELFDEDGLAGAARLFTGLTHPNFALLPSAIVEIFETVFIAFLGTIIAIPVAFLLAFLCAKNVMTHPAAVATYFTLRTILNISRSVEPLIWAIIFTVWVGVGPFAGMMALMIHSIASLTKQYSEIIESVADGPIEGVKSTGANAIQAVWFGIVPQVVLPYIAFTIYRWDINVRMATVIGLVGGGGIGTSLIKYYGQAMWPEVGCLIFVIAVVVWLMDTASAYIREALK